MRVAITLEQCWHRVPGGTAVAAIELARALGDRSDVDLVGVAARHRRPPPPGFEPPVDVRQLALPRLALYEAWHRWRRPAVEAATGPVDLIHATGTAMPPRSRRVVYTIHDLAFLHEPAHFTVNGLRFFHQALGLALQEADVVICPSRATAHDCEDAGFEPRRIRIVPLGVRAVPAAASDIERVRGAWGLDRYVLALGTIEPRKNLPALVEAFTRLDRSDVRLAIAGPLGWNEELGRHIHALGDRVAVLGFVPEADKAALYAGASVFCYPSLREGFGLPVLEAMAHGTPVVTSAGTAMEEVAGDSAVLADPTDAGSIADALAAVLDDPALAQRLATTGTERARQFTWARTADAVAGIYAEVGG